MEKVLQRRLNDKDRLQRVQYAHAQRSCATRNRRSSLRRKSKSWSKMLNAANEKNGLESKNKFAEDGKCSDQRRHDPTLVPSTTYFGGHQDREQELERPIKGSHAGENRNRVESFQPPKAGQGQTELAAVGEERDPFEDNFGETGRD